MRAASLRRLPLLFIAMFAVLDASPLHAQASDPVNIDSVTAALDSPDLEVRSAAVAALRTVTPSALPVATRLKLIALLEREANTVSEPRTDDGEDSAEGTYRTQLVRVVVRLQDPASARGLALVGLSINADAQRLVASRGDAAVALLEEAERVNPTLAGAVTATRGRMLGEYGGLLSEASRATIRAAVLRTAATDPLAFARAARLGRLVEAAPMVAQLAADATDDLSRSILGDAANQLTAQRAQATAESILSGLTESIAALCDQVQGARSGACEGMTHLAQSAFADVRASRPAAAHATLLALATRADNAARQGAITPIAGAMISGTARYLATRI
ncbi:MAG: hypothetical protein ACJ8AD_17065 [Gemmatimonadaceae bacterium]